jgi:hypothetical protein
VVPRAGLDDVEKSKFLTPPGLELRPLGRPPVASRYTDWAIPAPLDYMPVPGTARSPRRDSAKAFDVNFRRLKRNSNTEAVSQSCGNLRSAYWYN